MRRISSRSDITRSIAELNDLKEERRLNPERLFDIEGYKELEYVLDHWTTKHEYDCPKSSPKRTSAKVHAEQRTLPIQQEPIIGTVMDLSEFIEE